jgi:N-acetylglucosamine-6-phosphate deacetylase
MSKLRYGITAPLLVTAGQAIPLPLVIVEDGRIASVQSREHAEVPANLALEDFPECTLVPGFIDIHIHGGAGHDVMEGEESALARVERHLARTGVTSYFPTTVTAPMDITLASLEKLGRAVQRAAERGGEARAQPMGIHLEGPFISHSKCGVHPLEHIQPPSLELFERLWQAAQGTVRVMTLAPEATGAIELTAKASRLGVCVSMGHSDSTLEPVQAAISAGARHATHTFNAMRPLDHRQPGIVGEVLSHSQVTADIIADGIHVHPDVVRLFLNAKGAERAVLISDAISATGMGDGRYRLGSFEVQVEGERCLLDGKLAGSVLTLDRALQNAMRFSGWDLLQAIRLVTLNPAQVSGLTTRVEAGKAVPWKGTLEPGADADIVVLSGHSGGSRQVEVVKTIARGAGI